MAHVKYDKAMQSKKSSQKQILILNNKFMGGRVKFSAPVLTQTEYILFAEVLS